MRDLILLAALMPVVPLTFRFPIIGVLAWIWITLMNPHREVYGFLFGSPLNLPIALLTAVAWLFSRERKSLPLNAFTVALLAFTAWTGLTTALALDPAYSYKLFDRTLKTIILVLMVIMLANTKARIQLVVWAVVISIGYFAVKGGGFVLATAGQNRVFGPEASQIEDNNALGLALLVILPLINYLRMTSRVRVTRFGALGAMGLTLIAIIGTYSRGALVGLAAVAGVMAMRSRFGLVLLLVGGLVATTLPSFMPPAWLNRMSSIQEYDQDNSFNDRVAAWRTSWVIARERPAIGGGFSAVKLDKVVEEFHSPSSLTRGRAAHSIYFEVLGDHGFIGLGLYLIILAAAFGNTILVLNTARNRPDLDWAKHLARMLQVSMAAFVVSGAALSMAYYDGVLLVLGLTAALASVARQPATQELAARAGPKWKQAPASDIAA